MTRNLPHHPGRERGSAPVELMLLAPVLVAAALLVVLAGRQVSAQMSADAVAHAAARDASLQPDTAAASAAAHTTAETTLGSYGLACARFDLAVDLDGLRPGGTVTTTLTCTTDTSDLAVLGVGGSREITAQASVPIDRYRQERP